MRLLLRNFLRSLVLGSCFMSIRTQDLNQTDTTTITLPDNGTVKATLNAESTSEVISKNTVTKLMTVSDVVSSEPTQDYQMSTKMEVSTHGATTQPAFETTPEQITPEQSTPEQITPEQTTPEQITSEQITPEQITPEQTTPEQITPEQTAPEQIKPEQTTPKSVPERPTTQKDDTTMALEIVTSTTVTESATSVPSTSLHETTSADLTSSGHHQYETTIAEVPMTTGSTESLNPTTVSKQPTDMTESPPITSRTVDTTQASLITSTPTLISTSQSPLEPPELPHTASGDDFLSTHSTPSTTRANVGESISPLQSDWFLIIIVCAIVICVLFASMLLFVQWRKRNSSGKFGPGYVNGQSKKSKKKKGAERDAWAGPVYLEAEEGVECDEVQGALMSGDGNRDGDDVMLSTFAALGSEDTPNGGVGGEGTEEAKKWEEREPLLYIDEDAKEDNMGQTVGSNDRQEVNEKVANGEKMLNGEETFCITTAV